MAHQLAIPITKVIKDNLSLVMMFAYSQTPLREFRQAQFMGGWPYIDEVLFTTPEQIATRAMIELVLLFRTLDDHEDIDDGSLGDTFGHLYLKDGKVVPLSIREVANKTIHAKTIEWIFDDPKKPILKTTAHDNARENGLTPRLTSTHLPWAAPCWRVERTQPPLDRRRGGELFGQTALSAYPSSISSLTSWVRLTPPTVRTILAGGDDWRSFKFAHSHPQAG